MGFIVKEIVISPKEVAEKFNEIFDLVNYLSMKEICVVDSMMKYFKYHKKLTHGQLKYLNSIHTRTRKKCLNVRS